MVWFGHRRKLSQATENPHRVIITDYNVSAVTNWVIEKTQAVLHHYHGI